MQLLSGKIIYKMCSQWRTWMWIEVNEWATTYRRLSKRDRRAQKNYTKSIPGWWWEFAFDIWAIRETAGDVMQDGFVTVFSAIDSIQRHWFIRRLDEKIFINRAIEELRKNDVLRNAVDLDDVNETASPDESTLSGISAKELLDLISGLPPVSGASSICLPSKAIRTRRLLKCSGSVKALHGRSFTSQASASGKD